MNDVEVEARIKRLRAKTWRGRLAIVVRHLSYLFEGIALELER